MLYLNYLRIFINLLYLMVFMKCYFTSAMTDPLEFGMRYQNLFLHPVKPISIPNNLQLCCTRSCFPPSFAVCYSIDVSS
jgi:hypothetical protein